MELEKLPASWEEVALIAVPFLVQCFLIQEYYAERLPCKWLKMIMN